MIRATKVIGLRGGQVDEAFAQGLWRGREAVVLSNDRIRCSILRTGGVLAELAFAESEPGGENALWESPLWSDEGPCTSDAEIVARYGDLGDGRFLDAFTGHALCLDSFGPASAEAEAAGSGLHGEASLVRWAFSGQNAIHTQSQARLPFANATVQRAFDMRPGETVLRVRECVTNHESTVRRFHWVQHATVGAPMFGAASVVTTSAKQGMTSPAAYSDTRFMTQNAAFLWPHAPLASGETADLSCMFAHPAQGFVVALQQPHEKKYGFVAVANIAHQTALVYIFATRSFSWIAFWEENGCRQQSPWNGNVQARGLEFGTTPFPLGNETVDAAGPVLGLPSSRVAQPGETLCAPWLVALVRTPRDWASVEDVTMEPDDLLLRNGEQTLRITAAGVQAFLDGAKEER